MLNDARLGNHPVLKTFLQNAEEDIRLERSDSAGTDLRKILEYILKEYYLFYGQDPGDKRISDMLREMAQNEWFDGERQGRTHLTRRHKFLFYDIKNLGNKESHFDLADPHQGRPSVAKATAAYEDLCVFLPGFLTDIPAMLQQPRRVPARPAAPVPARPAVPTPPRPAVPVRPAAPTPPRPAAPVPAPRVINLPPVPRLCRIGRNDPCPCGSGLKFKNCCMNPKPVPALIPSFQKDLIRGPLVRQILELGDNRYGQLDYAMHVMADMMWNARPSYAEMRQRLTDGKGGTDIGIQRLTNFFNLTPDHLRTLCTLIRSFQKRMQD